MKNNDYSTSDKYETVILGGQVIDVVKGVTAIQNIGINNGKIAAISKGFLEGWKEINANGLLVSPGFIDFHSHVDGNPYAGKCMVMQGGTTTLGGERDLNRKTFRRIEEEGFIINQGFSVSHSFVLRSAVGITNPHQPATDQEIKIMADLARSFLESGAFSICFVLELIPGTSKKELIEVAKVAKEYDRLVTVHMRKDGREALQHFDELLELASMGVKLHLLQLMYMVGIGGAMEPALQILDAAIASGLDITADSGVYDAYTVCIGTGVFEEGWEKEYGTASVEDLVISSGTFMGEHCTEQLFHRLRKEFPATLVTAFVCDKEAIPMALKRDYVYCSTNATDGPYYPGMGAPEVSGTFPRLLGKYVREHRQLSLMEAIRKITILPARRYGLQDVGSLEVGKNADIVIFDPEEIIDQSTFIGRGKPDEPPKGITYVLVNGEVVVEKGQLTENLSAGRLVLCNYG
jgi:N-acyl-D-amino-acid deacylase